MVDFVEILCAIGPHTTVAVCGALEWATGRDVGSRCCDFFAALRPAIF